MASQGPPSAGRNSMFEPPARNSLQTSLGPRGRNNTLTIPGPGAGQAEMRSLFFILAMRDEMDNEPFIRMSAETIKTADLIMGLINGTKGKLHITHTEVPINTGHVMVHAGRPPGCCACCCCVENMDHKQYRVSVSSNMLIFIHWGNWIRIHRIDPGPQVLFFNKCKDMKNVVVSGSIPELGDWSEKAAQKKTAFNVLPGLCISAATVPHTEQDIEFNLVNPTPLGAVWESNQNNKTFHHPGTHDITVVSTWQEDDVFTSEIPTHALTILDIHRRQSSFAHMAASLYRMAHARKSSFSLTRGSKASDQDIKNFAAELHAATKDDENSEDEAKDEVCKKVVSIHNISTSKDGILDEKNDKEPIVKKNAKVRQRWKKVGKSLINKQRKSDHDEDISSSAIKKLQQPEGGSSLKRLSILSRRTKDDDKSGRGTPQNLSVHDTVTGEDTISKNSKLSAQD